MAACTSFEVGNWILQHLRKHRVLSMDAWDIIINQILGSAKVKKPKNKKRKNKKIKKDVDIRSNQWYSNEAVAQDNMLRSQRENCLKNENKAWLNAKCMII